MNLFERVKKYHLPTGQFRVIERILNDLETFSFLSGNELCNEFDISYSSLTRMAKALKYSGFPELKKEIENLYKSESSPTSQAELFINSVKAKSILDIVMHDEINNLSKLKTSINESEIIETAKQINKSKRVFIVGIGKMEFIVDKFASGLALLGLETYKLTELGFSKQLEAHSLNKDDVVIAFSINKELEELENTLVQLKEKNINAF